MSRREPAKLLEMIKGEALSKAHFDLLREGMYRGALKAAFIRSFEFARFIHRRKPNEADEGAFFLSAALRGVCEDLIALKFIRLLKRKERDEVIQIKMLWATSEAAAKQAQFFRKNRPFQPVLTGLLDPAKLSDAKDRLTVIGQQSSFWNTSRKLPPIEQMARRVRLKSFYDFIYAVTSEVVHFSVRIAFRSGWGRLPMKARFSAKNFCGYYLEFSQFYSAYLLAKFCHAFRKDLRFSDDFIEVIEEMENGLHDRLRWPEAVTFEEMNQQNPNELLRTVLKVAHLDKVRGRQFRHGKKKN
jgi:hypothetical protein